MPRKVVIISQDYDGCYSIMTDMALVQETTGYKKSYWSKKETIDGISIGARIDICRTAYTDYLSKITEDANEVRVYVGSARQCYFADQSSMRRNNNGSVFSALEELCDRRTMDTKPWKFETLLIADPENLAIGRYGRERGVAYERIKKRLPEHMQLKQPVEYDDSSKVYLLLTQMWDAYRENPDAEELEFHFIDDSESLINEALRSITPDLLPPKMTFKASVFAYSKMMNNPKDMESNGGLHLCGQVELPKVSSDPHSSCAPSTHRFFGEGYAGAGAGASEDARGVEYDSLLKLNG